MIERLFSRARSTPDDDFIREGRREMREADANISPERLAEIEELDDREDELEAREIAAAVYCPACHAPAGEPCPVELHYERRARYARR